MTARDATGAARLDDYEVERNCRASNWFCGCTTSGTFHLRRHTGVQAGDPHGLVATRHPKLHAPG